MYSEKVIDHFTNPRNVGEIENCGPLPSGWRHAGKRNSKSSVR